MGRYVKNKKHPSGFPVLGRSTEAMSWHRPLISDFRVKLTLINMIIDKKCLSVKIDRILCNILSPLLSSSSMRNSQFELGIEFSCNL